MLQIVTIPKIADMSGLYDVEPDSAEYVVRGLLQIAVALQRKDSAVSPRPFFDLAALISAVHLAEQG